jgi:hypothetical protein
MLHSFGKKTLFCGMLLSFASTIFSCNNAYFMGTEDVKKIVKGTTTTSTPTPLCSIDKDKDIGKLQNVVDAANGKFTLKTGPKLGNVIHAGLQQPNELNLCKDINRFGLAIAFRRLKYLGNFTNGSATDTPAIAPAYVFPNKANGDVVDESNVTFEEIIMALLRVRIAEFKNF